MKRLISDRRGFAAAEFALIVPLFSLITIATIQAGLFFWAKAGLEHAVGEGARLASIYPRQTNDAIIAKIRATAFGTNSASLQTPTLTAGTVGKVDYVDINVSYNAKIVVFNIPAITLTENRRVYRP